MFGFFKKGFGGGGNTLVLLLFFLGLGFTLHFKERFFPEGSLLQTAESIFTASGGDELGLLAGFSREESEHLLPVEGLELDEILERSDFVRPANRGKDRLQIVQHTGFSLGYNENYEQAAWVGYPLWKEQVTGPSSRERFFNPDPKVKTGSALFSDYTRSGYDRGHLAAAADFRHSQEQMRETFYMSNISPQNRDFNGGIWNELEKLVRAWAVRYEKVYVVTGPVLRPGLPTIGKVNKVAVPEQFYKVVLYAKPPYVKGIAFLLDNQPSSLPLSKAVISIDSLEQITGLDFFPMLPDAISQRVKAKSIPKEWPRLK